MLLTTNHRKGRPKMANYTENNSSNNNGNYDLSYLTDDELPALIDCSEAQDSETEVSGDEGLPALEYDEPSSLPLHSPSISHNNWCDLLATPQVIQYPDDILITGWGSPHILNPSSIRLWRTLLPHCMQSVHDSQSLTTSSVPSKKDQCPDER